MSRSLRAAIGFCTAVLCVFVLSSEIHAQWWEFGSGPRGGMRYRGPLLSIDIGGAPVPPAVVYPAPHHAYGLVPAPVPPWHFRHDVPQPAQSFAAQERFYYDLDRTHRYRTREERYMDDFRDRYTAGDPFYHSYRHALPPNYGHVITDHDASVPGLSYGPVGAQGRSFVADADVADLLRPAANRLTSSLSRKRDGAVWMKQLQPDRIIDAIDRAEFPGSLADLVEHYDAVAHNPRLVLIAESDGFKDTHRLLSQYILLQSRFATSEYAEVPHEVFMGSGPHDSVVIDSAPTLNPPATQVNPAAPTPPTGAASSGGGEEIIQYLPAPVGEPDPDR